MKIERISDYKLKITLRPEDMLHWLILIESATTHAMKDKVIFVLVFE